MSQRLNRILDKWGDYADNHPSILYALMGLASVILILALYFGITNRQETTRNHRDILEVQTKVVQRDVSDVKQENARKALACINARTSNAFLVLVQKSPRIARSMPEPDRKALLAATRAYVPSCFKAPPTPSATKQNLAAKPVPRPAKTARPGSSVTGSNKPNPSKTRSSGSTANPKPKTPKPNVTQPTPVKPDPGPPANTGNPPAHIPPVAAGLPVNIPSVAVGPQDHCPLLAGIQSAQVFCP